MTYLTALRYFVENNRLVYRAAFLLFLSLNAFRPLSTWFTWSTHNIYLSIVVYEVSQRWDGWPNEQLTHEHEQSSHEHRAVQLVFVTNAYVARYRDMTSSIPPTGSKGVLQSAYRHIVLRRVRSAGNDAWPFFTSRIVRSVIERRNRGIWGQQTGYCCCCCCRPVRAANDCAYLAPS